MSSNEPWRMHPVLGVRNVRAAVEAFVKQLGFRVVGAFPGIDPAEGLIYAIVERGGCELHLQIRRRELWTAPRISIENDVYVHVADADALHAELAARGAEILRRPEDQPYGRRDFTVAAPEGYRLIFGSPLPR
jgi:uncharacterized glyoxalase superfamily protein PhnB